MCRKADSSIRSVSFFIYTHTVYAMQTTRVELSDTLPLTCSRRGTCCFGNQVLLNPWELACLAAEKGISPRQFRDSFCDLGGTRLMFNGDTGWMGKKACGMYVHNFGCSLHVARPLACRLYPIGRQIQSAQVHYMYEGRQFPCLSGCPEVTTLPHITVFNYLQGQQTLSFEQAQDGYLEVVQNLADMAFVLLLETDLAATAGSQTIALWLEMGGEDPQLLAERIGEEWLTLLQLPSMGASLNNPMEFVQAHNTLLQQKAQQQFGELQSISDVQSACVHTMALALHLSRSVGANPATLASHWTEVARGNGV